LFSWISQVSGVEENTTQKQFISHPKSGKEESDEKIIIEKK
jgi:hypothetical protein